MWADGMARRRRFQSATTRLTIGIIVVACGLSVGSGYLSWQREQTRLAAVRADAAAPQLREQIIHQTLLIAAATLSSLLLIRRCMASPLADVIELVDVGARHEPFFELAREQRGEFRHLTRALGDMVRQIEDARPLPDASEVPAAAVAHDPQECDAVLAASQKQQLRVLRCAGPALAEATCVDTLLERTAERMFDLLGVDAVGMAVRDGAHGRRVRQVLHRGRGSYLLTVNEALVRRVETDLLPEALMQPDLLYWRDLDTAETGWSGAFVAGGLTSAAAVGIRGSHDAQGVLWIGQRGGNRLDPSSLHLLEALVPLVAVRLELVQLRERLEGLCLSDPVTGLPSALQFDQARRQMVGRPGRPCAVCIIELDQPGIHEPRPTTVQRDGLMRAVASRLLSATRRSSFLAKLEGASYGLIMTGVEHDAACRLGQRLVDVVAAEPFHLTSGTEEPIFVTVSAGVACFPEDGVRSDELLDLAHIRVAAARRMGGCCVATGHLADAARLAG